MTKIPIEEEKHAGGRPSEYHAGCVESVSHYLQRFEEVGEVVPTVQGLAWFLGVTSRTVNRWCEEHEEFCRAVETLKDRQAVLLQNKGLRKETDSGITKLMLSANHGVAEKSESKQEHSGTVGLTVVTKVPDGSASS